MADLDGLHNWKSVESSAVVDVCTRCGAENVIGQWEIDVSAAMKAQRARRDCPGSKED